jgi:hypothetical protein
MTVHYESPRMLQAGVSRRVITPPLGIRMAGYTVQECAAEAVERDLTATALVLSDGTAKAVLIACDLLFIQAPHVDRMRGRIGESLGVPPAQVLINTSHTHLGPMLPGWHPVVGEQAELQEHYLHELEARFVEAARDAHGALQPARFGSAKGSAPVGINRREKFTDGRVIIGENAAGAVDHDVDVVRFDDLSGKPLATVYSAAAHPIVLGPHTPQLSPDYVGPARELIEKITGALSLFLQGAAGNVCPRCGIGIGGPEQFDDMRRLGTLLGGEVVKVWSQIRTHNQRGPRTFMNSVAVASMWGYESLPPACIKEFGVSDRRQRLAMAPPPEPAAARAELRRRQEALTEAQASGSRGRVYVAERLVHWAERVVAAAEKGQPPVQELRCWGLRINDLGIVAVNGEAFAELGLTVKDCSPLRHTLFLGYSNGCLGYLPTPEAFAEGGMEVEDSYRNYLLPTPFTPQWGPAVVENCLELLKSL